MSFASFVSRVFGKRPIWLYRFTVGSQIFHMTSNGAGWVTPANAPDDTYPAGQAFTAAAIVRGEIFQTTLSNRSDTWVRLPTPNALIQAILDNDDVESVDVAIWQTFAGDPDQEYVLKFTGRVVNVEPTLILTTLVCDSDLTEMVRTSVAQVVQRPCRHAHYFTNSDGGGCRLDVNTFLQAATATAVSGAVVTVPAAALQPDGNFNAGVLRYGLDEYMIEAHTGDQLRLNRLPTALATDIGAGDQPVLIAEGCDLTPARCNEFGNIENFGGFPWMRDSPFDGRSLV